MLSEREWTKTVACLITRLYIPTRKLKVLSYYSLNVQVMFLTLRLLRFIVFFYQYVSIMTIFTVKVFLVQTFTAIQIIIATLIIIILSYKACINFDEC